MNPQIFQTAIIPAVGRRLGVAMAHLQINATDVWHLTGISKSTVGWVLRGERAPSFELLYMLRAVLKINPDWLFYGDAVGNAFVGGGIGGNPMDLGKLSEEELREYAAERLREMDLPVVVE